MPTRRVPPTHESTSDVKHSELNTAANVFVPVAATAAIDETASAAAVLAAAAATAAKTHMSAPLPADNVSSASTAACCACREFYLRAAVMSLLLQAAILSTILNAFHLMLAA